MNIKIAAFTVSEKSLNTDQRIGFQISLYNTIRIFTHIDLASSLWDIDKQCNPYQTPQNSASDLGLYDLITECSIKTEFKMKNTTTLKPKRTVQS